MTGHAAAARGLAALRKNLPATGRYAFLLKLNTPSTTAAFRSRAPQGVAAARSAARLQAARVVTAQNTVISRLPAGSRVLYRAKATLAGVALTTDVANAAALYRLPGVAAVYPIAPKTLDNSYAVPFQHAPQAWTAYGNTGANSTVAIIDTGIDYTHADFGGPGTKAAYDTAHAAEATDADPALFPNAKVVGGYDLVGDAYNADPASPTYNPVPAPDRNPLDCNGHGSHVGGTAAGYGVNGDGTTYRGAYNNSTDFASMRIGPGIAPGAKLYAFRVFGCDGSSDVVGAAIERASDPNGDGDPSDHVDVINMSLGSDYGSPQDGDSVVSDMAAALGIEVVAASGNAGDAQSIVDTLKVTAPPTIAGNYAAERSIAYDWETQPDLQGTVVKLTDPSNLDGCDPFSPADTTLVAGKVVFLEWTDDDAVRRCGSVTRSGNAVAAGAIGFVFGSDSEAFSAGITGSAVIPGVLLAKSGADAMRAQLASNTRVTVGGTSANDFNQQIPALNDTVAGFTSRGIRGAGNLKPDLGAVGATVFSAASGTGNDGVSESGTSMATPMIAGAAALVTTQHPDWTSEMVKADLMNTAEQDLYTDPNHSGSVYAPNRVGAGRMDVKAAIDNTVLAYVGDDPGAVSASFGPQAVSAVTTRTKTIKVQNTGVTARTYAVSYEGLTSVPGVSYSVSPASVTVDPRSMTTVTLTLTMDPSRMTKTVDPTVDLAPGGLPREFLADASGRVLFTADGQPQLRVPVYSAPRPASVMTQASSVTLPNGRVQSALFPLSGKPVNQGSGATAINSTVSGFELAATSGVAPACSASVPSGCVQFSDERAADLKNVGITSDATQIRSVGGDPTQAGQLFFAINTQGPWRTAASFVEYDVLIDVNGDKKADFAVFNTRIVGASDTDTLVANTIDLATGKSVDLEGINDRLGNYDTALFDSDTMVLPVAIGALGLGKNSRISYGIASFSPYQSSPVDSIGLNANGDPTGALTFDPLKPGLAVYGTYTGSGSTLLFDDSPGAVLKIRRDRAAYAADHALGALMVHFHNGLGSKAQRVTIKSTPSVSLRFAPSTVKRGAHTSVTARVSPSAGVPATGTVRLVRLNGPRAPITSITMTVRRGVAHASYPTARLAPGRYRYRADYTGDAHYNRASSTTVTLVVTR